MAQKVLLSSFSHDSKVVYRRLYKARSSVDALIRETDPENRVILDQQCQSRLWKASVRFTAVFYKEQPKLVDYCVKSAFVGVDMASLMLGVSMGLPPEAETGFSGLSTVTVGHILANIDRETAAVILLRLPFYITNEMLALDEHLKLGLHRNTEQLPITVPENNPYNYYSSIAKIIDTMFFFGTSYKPAAIEILGTIRIFKGGRQFIDNLLPLLDIDPASRFKVLNPGKRFGEQLMLPFAD